MDLQKMGKIISEMRKKKALTQNQLGDMLGVSGKAVSKWERGISAPDISILNELSKILEISVSEILTGEKMQNTISKETVNEITVSGIGAYNNFFKKKYTKVIFILISILLLVTVTFSITYVITNYNKCFVYELSSGSDDFFLEGLIASNQRDNRIIITNMLYTDSSTNTTKELRVDNINLILKLGKIEVFNTKKYFSEEKLSDVIKDFNITISEDNKIANYILDDNKNIKAKIIIYYTGKDNKGSIVIPIKIEKKFSNNKIFY